MNLSNLDNALWIVAGVTQFVLLGILVGKGRWHRFPWFTTFVAFEALGESVALMIVYRVCDQKTYFWTYWILAVVDVLLQMGIVYEMAREVLRPAGFWVRRARAFFVRWGLIGAAAAALLSYAVHPRGSGDSAAWLIRANIFTGLLMCELIVAMFWASQELSLQWRDWVMGIARGLGVWICVGLVVEIAHGYWGWTANYVALDRVRIGSYILALLMCSVSFWHTEPERQPMSPELQKVLETWRKGFEYDVTTE